MVSDRNRFPGVSSGQFLLGQKDVDIGGFDDVRATDGRRLDYKDSETFFSRYCKRVEISKKIRWIRRAFLTWTFSLSFANAARITEVVFG